MNDKRISKKSAPKTESAPRGGMPGDGTGRIEDTGTRGHGVFPVSGPPSGNPDARMQGMASFGQGERGAAGYENSGRSEVFTMPPGDMPAAGRAASPAADAPNAGSNAGEVDPGISGSGETVGEPPRNTGGAQAADDVSR
jgi:hypothetical protein